MKTCSVDGCGRDRWARGWCTTHYQRWRTHGDVMPDMPVNAPMSREERLDAFTDKTDGCWLYTGTVSKWTGYGTIGNVGVHRIAWEREHGPIPDGMVLDHVCHNEAAERGECEGGNSCGHRRCCNPDHLRLVTHAENLEASPHTMNGRGRTPCAADGCEFPRDRYSGHCNKHHQRWLRYGDANFLTPRMTRPAICSWEGCDRKHHANGYCGMHGHRVRRDDGRRVGP